MSKQEILAPRPGDLSAGAWDWGGQVGLTTQGPKVEEGRRGGGLVI